MLGALVPLESAECVVDDGTRHMCFPKQLNELACAKREQN